MNLQTIMPNRITRNAPKSQNKIIDNARDIFKSINYLNLSPKARSRGRIEPALRREPI